MMKPCYTSPVTEVLRIRTEANFCGTNLDTDAAGSIERLNDIDYNEEWE